MTDDCVSFSKSAEKCLAEVDAELLRPPGCLRKHCLMKVPIM
jgi:hypothetical protein